MAAKISGTHGKPRKKPTLGRNVLLVQKREHIRRFLPCMPIACARQLQHKIGANRARAADVAKRIRPLFAEPFEAALSSARHSHAPT